MEAKKSKKYKKQYQNGSVFEKNRGLGAGKVSKNWIWLCFDKTQNWKIIGLQTEN